MRATAWCLTLAALTGCTVDTGVVEVAWVVVDRTGEALFPAGQLAANRRRDSCRFEGRTDTEVIRFDLRTTLQICDPLCAAGCADPTCHVIPTLQFPCDVARGSNPDVPSSADDYRFTLIPQLEVDGLGTCVPSSTCVAVPGPRERAIDPGRVVDLQVYQIAMNIEAGASGNQGQLDLQECGCV